MWFMTRTAISVTRRLPVFNRSRLQRPMSATGKGGVFGIVTRTRDASSIVTPNRR